MNTIKAGQTLTARSACDHNCHFSVKVIARKGGFVTILDDNRTRRVKVRADSEGNEYLMPDSYSMAPIYRALPENCVAFVA
jgi:hypothetical protein